MRLINADVLRDKFIETLENVKKDPKMTREEIHIIAACDTVVQMIDDMPTMYLGQWISVEDRLPEDGETVLISDGETLDLGFYDDDKKRWWIEANDIASHYISPVTHWQPLPKLPQTEPCSI